MKKLWLAALALLVASAGLANAQVEEAVVPPAIFTPACPERCGLSMWGSTEYLLGWIKNGPMPFPLVTAGDPNDPVSPGAWAGRARCRSSAAMASTSAPSPACA